MDLQYLREATRAEHEGTESEVSLMQPGLTRAEYVLTLQRFYGAVRGWEQWAANHVPQDLSGLLSARQRSMLIRKDLEFLGATTPAEQPPSDWLQGALAGADQARAAFLGGMYVVEGSTLGGQYIAKHLEEVFKLSPGEGDAYFRGYGEQTGSMWRQFKETLATVPDERTETVVQAAKLMFAYFRLHLSEPIGAEL